MNFALAVAVALSCNMYRSAAMGLRGMVDMQRNLEVDSEQPSLDPALAAVLTIRAVTENNRKHLVFLSTEREKLEKTKDSKWAVVIENLKKMEEQNEKMIQKFSKY
ncbi:MAG: hypothetical protein ACRCZF_09665 [Gemmataceae bacterium]